LLAAGLGGAVAPGRIAAAYDSGDGVHPSDAGAGALAAAVDPAVFLRGRHAGMKSTRPFSYRAATPGMNECGW
jgi:hypothetical protein